MPTAALVSAESALTRREIPAGPDLWSELRPIWRSLLDRTGERSAFLSEAWIACWLEHFGLEADLSALIWSDTDGTPVGCVLLSNRRRRIGVFPVSRSYLNASGVEGVGCEHNDVLVLDRHRVAVLDDLTSDIRARGTDELGLEGMRKSAFEEFSERWPTDDWQGFTSESPYVDLDRIRESGEDFLMSLSSNSRSQIRRSIRLYEERFGAPSVVTATSAEEAEQSFTDMVDLHRATWRERGEEGAFASQDLKRFYSSLIERAVDPEASDALKVDLVRIRFGEETIGILFNFVHRGIVSFYQSGLSYDEDSRLKPGLVSHTLAIEECIARGEQEYDFLGGEAHGVRYKRSLSNQRRHLVWAQLPAPTLKMRMIRRVRLGRRRVRAALKPDR